MLMSPLSEILQFSEDATMGRDYGTGTQWYLRHSSNKPYK